METTIMGYIIGFRVFGFWGLRFRGVGFRVEGLGLKP